MPNEPAPTPVESTPSRTAVVLDTQEDIEALADLVHDADGEQ